MRKELKMVYSYDFKCVGCSEIKEIYYTVSDFGDAPFIMKCKQCGELYWYTPDDEVYLRPLDEQLMGVHCEYCKQLLSDTLTQTHKDINCCGEHFSLDDEFIIKSNLSDTEMVSVEVYLIYS